MREIKFKVLDKHGWHFYYLESLLQGEYTTADIDNGKWEAICEFTGLKDKNGKEIYEGDIVSSDKVFGEVVWGYDASWGIHGKLIEKDWENCEVIGNIYENKELLKI
jgi:hypothetical protein